MLVFLLALFYLEICCKLFNPKNTEIILNAPSHFQLEGYKTSVFLAAAFAFAQTLAFDRSPIQRFSRASFW
jgi:hypothetical protein